MSILYENLLATANSAWDTAVGRMYFVRGFTPLTNHPLDIVELYMAKETGSSPGTITVGVYAADSIYRPTGSALASGTYNGNSLGNYSGGLAWIQFTLNTTLNVIVGNKYAIRITSAAVGLWTETDSNGAGGVAGNSYRSADASSWTDIANYSFLFGLMKSSVTYPTDPLLRVNGYRRSYYAPKNGALASYQMEIVMGGGSTNFASPIGTREPASVTEEEAGLTHTDYNRWLTNNWQHKEFVMRVFGHFPTYEEWLTFMKTGQAPQGLPQHPGSGGFQLE